MQNAGNECFAWTTKLTLQKQNMRDKSSLKSHFLNLHHNSEHVDGVISSMGIPQENRIFQFLKLHKRMLFIQIEICFHRISLHEISDQMGKNFLTIWALLCKLLHTVVYRGVL